MTEPLYTYVKGEGWVVQSCGSILATMRCGTAVRIEARAPNIGEAWLRAYAWFNPETDEPDLERFRKCAEQDFTGWKQLVELRVSKNVNDYVAGKGFVTVVLL